MQDFRITSAMAPVSERPSFGALLVFAGAMLGALCLVLEFVL